MTKEQLKARMERRLVKLVKELGQIVRDIRYYNTHNIHGAVLDLECDRLAYVTAKQSLAAIRRGDMDELNRLSPKLMEHVAAAASAKD